MKYSTLHSANLAFTRCDLTEKVKTHVVILRFLFRLLNLGSSCGGCCRSGRWGSCGSEGRGVGQVSLQLLGGGESDVRLGGNGHQVLQAVHHRVGSGGHGGVPDGQGQSSDVGNTGHEGGLEVVVGDVQNLGAEDWTVVIDIHHQQSIREGRDVKHVQEGGL